MKNVLVIYETVPEKTEMFLVNANIHDEQFLNLAHGNYINIECDDAVEKAMDAISLFLGSPNEISESDREAAIECGIAIEEIGKWQGKNVMYDNMVDVAKLGIDAVVVTGFIL